MLTNSLDLQESLSVLEIPSGCSLNDAKASYRDLVRVWHPDRFQSDARLQRRCEEKIKRLNAAYHVVEAALANAPVVQPVIVPPAPRPSAGAAVGGVLEPVLYRGKWGYADKSGVLHITPVYDSAGEFSEGLGAVSRGGAFGYVSKDGSLAIDLRFTAAQRFSEGLALVKFGRSGYINRSGEWAIRPRFDAGLEFRHGVAGVKLDGKWGLIDAQGKWLVLPRFEEMQEFESGRALAREGARSYTVYPSGEVRAL